MTPTSDQSPAAQSSATQRPAGRGARPAFPAGLAKFFALDNWFRVVSFDGGRPDGYTSLCELFLAFLCFLAGCVAMLCGYCLWWGFYAFVPVAGWFTLRHWSRTFYLRLRGNNRWVMIDYARMFSAAVRVFAAVWALYLLAAPLRPASVDPPPADLLAAAEAAIPEERLPPDILFACGYGPGMIGRGTQQILDSRFLAFFFGTSPDELRRIAENRKAWWRVIEAARRNDVGGRELDALHRDASRADRAHLFLGRGGIPHLLDHVLFGSHQWPMFYDGLVPRSWVF